MTPQKRLFDIFFAILLMALLALPFLALVIYLLWSEGRPVFYVSERMRSPTQGFRLWKLRTMSVAKADAGVSGGDKSGRISPMGQRLRRFRADEVPQLWNILKGDMSFVGPRPPLRMYVERFPDIYDRVLACRPGVTGLATVVFHRHEERILAQCHTAEETDQVYSRRCVPRKARLDLIYARRRSLCLDLWVIGKTLRKTAT